MRLPWSSSFGHGLAVLLLAAAGGCEPEQAEAVHTMVGQVDEDLFVAVVSDDHDMVIYACDGTANAVTVAAWFQGPHDGGRFDLPELGGDARAEGELDASTGQGSLAVDGVTLPFTLEPAADEAGLYFDVQHDAEDTKHWGGWIVRRDGSIRGSVINRKTGGIVAAGDAAPDAEVTVDSLAFEVVRLESPELEGSER